MAGSTEGGGAELEVTIRVRRFDPTTGRRWWQEYRVRVDRYASLVTALQRIRMEQDPTLAFTAGCRMGVCGACAVKVDGRPTLACQLIIYRYLGERGGEPVITVEPLDGFPVVRDLVVDRGLLDEEWRRFKAWLIPGKHLEEFIGEHPMPPPLQKRMWRLDKCIMCGSCFTACPVYGVAEGYPGPAILAKTMRFALDPRDALRDARLEELAEAYWTCLRCGLCSEVCPHHVPTPEAVEEARRHLVIRGAVGRRDLGHITAALEGLLEYGRMDEVKLFLRTAGPIEALREAIALARRVKRRPPLRPKPAPRELLEEVRRAAGVEG